MPRIEMSKLVEKMDLKNLTPDVDLSGIYLEEPEVNRPALQLTGYFDHLICRVYISGTDGPGRKGADL